jgi:hypothetical protein
VNQFILLTVHTKFFALETTLEEMLVATDAEPEYQQPVTSDDIEMEIEDEEPTPRPTKKKDQHSVECSDVEQDEQFQTPLTLKKPKNRKSTFIEIDDSSLSELSDLEEPKKVNEKGKGKKAVKAKIKDGRNKAKVCNHLTFDSSTSITFPL